VNLTLVKLHSRVAVAIAPDTAYDRAGMWRGPEDTRSLVDGRPAHGHLAQLMHGTLMIVDSPEIEPENVEAFPRTARALAVGLSVQ
jgi:hypothetical protein